jgi:dipeptidyl aminopeptidase/acylaminoacyl peptidase
MEDRRHRQDQISSQLELFPCKRFRIYDPKCRGSTGYGKEYTALDDYKKRMDSVKDGYYAAKYLIDAGYTEKGKIGIEVPAMEVSW